MDASVKKRVDDVDLDTIITDISTLKSDIAKILEHLKSATIDSAVDSAQTLAEQISDEASGLYKEMSKRGQRTAKVITRKVEDQPALSLLIAFALGMVASRVFLR